MIAVSALILSASFVDAQEFERVPLSWKWTARDEVVFTYDGSYTDADAFSVTAPSKTIKRGVKAPEKAAAAA